MAMENAFTANCRHIAKFEAKPYPRQQSPDAVTPAFEGFAYAKIVSELRSENAVIKAKAVIAARDLLCMSLKHMQCIAAGITPALVQLLEDQDESLQAAAAVTLQLLMAKEVGCRDVLQHEGLPLLLQQLKHHSAAVKDAAYGALCGAARFEALRLALTRQGRALAQLIGHAQQEEPVRAAHALDLLWQVTQVRHNQDALFNLIHLVNAVPKLAAMINDSSAAESVRLGAAKLLAALMSTQEEARTQAVDAGCIAALLQMLTATTAEMAVASSAALMTVSLCKSAKLTLHELHAADKMVEVLTTWQQLLKHMTPGSQQEEFIVNLLQTVANLAELPQCRIELQRSHAGALSSMLQGMQQQDVCKSDSIKQAAETASRMIQFSTWPGVCTP